jgi:PilZ domain
MRERRKVPRYQLGKLAMLYPAGGGVGTKAVVYSISAQGCSIECEKSPEVGKKCELYIDTENAQIGLEAVAVSIESNGRTGLKFVAVDKETQKRLGDLCATLRVQALSAPVLGEVETGQSPFETSAAKEPPPAPAAPWVPPAPLRAPASLRERRRVPRYVSELRANLVNSSTGAASKVSLITLSVLGGCLEGSDLPEPGQACEIRTEWEGRALGLPGKIVWKARGRRVGILFDALEESSEKLLRHICANLRLQPLAPLPSEPL